MPYLGKPSDSIEDPTVGDIREATRYIQTADKEHAAFWFGTDEEELVLEVHGDLTGFLILDGGNTTRKFVFSNWEQVEEMFIDLVEGRFEKVKSVIANIA